MGSKVERAIEHLVVLVADNSAYMRKLMRTMLDQSGVKGVYEAGDGIAALEAIRSVNPDVLIINWDLAVLSGSEVVRMVRSPEAFPRPDLPVIMLLDDGLCSRVLNAAQLGVHELLIKPVSAKMLQERLLALTLAPRPMMRAGGYYGPTPRGGEFKAMLNAAVQAERSPAEIRDSFMEGPAASDRSSRG
jgi:CheY-like chemotaxis protein